MIIVIIHVDGL